MTTRAKEISELGNTGFIELDANGNLGIGTDSPTQTLHVEGDIRLGSGNTSRKIVFGSAGAANDYIELIDVNSSANIFNLVQDGNSKLVVQGVTGNVGIGTTSPQEKLEVNGVLQIRRDGDHPALRFAEINSGTTTTRGYIASGDWAVNGGAIDDFGISGSVTGDLLLATNAGTERLRIQNSTGYVGIGTNAPTNMLTTKSGASYGGLDLYTNNTNYRHTVGVRGNTLDLIANRDNTDADGDIRFHVGGTGSEKMIINRAGNVGIGTLQPSRPLTIQGSSEVLRVTSSGATDSHTDFHIDGNEFSIRIDDDNVRGSSVFTLDIDSDEKMRIDEYGDMALGSTTAYSTLYVKGGSGSATKKNLTTFGTSNLGGSQPDLDTASIVLGSYSGRTFVSGNYIAGIAFDHLLNHQTASPYSYGQNPHAWLGLKMWDSPGYERSSLIFATRPNTGSASEPTVERMEITPYGNVGINRTSPPTTLTVNGTQRIEIDSNPSGFFSQGADMHRDGAIVFPVTASQTTQTSDNGGGWATIGWATTARSGEQMHRLQSSRYANGGSGTAMGFYIEAGTGEAGGICLDEDSVQVYGSSDSGTTFRIIDKDSDVVTAEMLQNSWNWNVRGSVNASASMSSISDQRLKKGFLEVSSDGILDSFANLQLKSYIRVDTYDYMKNNYTDEEELREVGFVAQEVEAVFPDCVGTTPIVDPRGMDSIWEEIGEELTEIKNVNVNQMLYKTMQAVQELIKENNDLKARLAALESN